MSGNEKNGAPSVEERGQSIAPDPISGPDAFAGFVAAALVSPAPFPLETNFDPLVPQPSDDQLEIMRSQLLACLLANHQRFYNTYALLGDRRSKELYLQQLLFRLLGYKLARSPCNTREYWARRAFCMAVPSEPSRLSELLPDIRHFRWQSGTTPLHLDCTYFSILQHHLGQYHLERPDVVVRPEPGDHVVDIGFFIADVALDFACDVGPSGRVYGFDIAIADPVRRAYFGPGSTTSQGWLEARVVNRSALATPHAGPCIVEEYDATCLVPPGWTARLDRYGNIVMSR